MFITSYATLSNLTDDLEKSISDSVCTRKNEIIVMVKLEDGFLKCKLAVCAS